MSHYNFKVLVRWRSGIVLALLFAFNALPALAEDIKTEIHTKVVVKDAAMMAKAKAASEAIKSGNKTELESLISKGLNVNMIIMAGSMDAAPLLWVAAEQGKKEIVEFLLSNGADMQGKEVFLGTTALHIAAQKGDLAIVETLINHGADVNLQSGNQDTPLRLAYKHLAVAKALIDHGANINAQDRRGRTILMMANLKLAKFLIAKGADVNIHARDGATALHEACDTGPEMVKLLLDHGAEVNAQQNNGEAPLHEAMDNVACAKLLIAAGANVDVQDKYGKTPLYDAVSRGKKELVALLLAKGAKPNIKNNNNGQSPLDRAVIYKKTEIIALLKAHGAK